MGKSTCPTDPIRQPEELIFDSRLTTHANLDKLNRRGIDFITLRRRTDKLLHQIHQEPLSAWKRIELENIARQYRTPSILDRLITLPGYQGNLRQIAITDMGHEEPALRLNRGGVQRSVNAPRGHRRELQRPQMSPFC
ncbi:MAG: hypothetical protein ACHRHE_15005 [Tepidisphaerales bacterium]